MQKYYIYDSIKQRKGTNPSPTFKNQKVNMCDFLSQLNYRIDVKNLGDLLSETEYDIHNHVFVCVQSPETKTHCVSVALE